MISPDLENIQNSSGEVQIQIKDTQIFCSNAQKKVFTCFFPLIGIFLTKKEKINLNEINKEFLNEIVPELTINLTLKKKSDEDEFTWPQSSTLKQIIDRFKRVEKLVIENIRLNDDILDAIETIVSNNSGVLQSISLSNIDYQTFQCTSRMYDILNQMVYLEEMSIGNVGNRDRLILHLNVNDKLWSFAGKVKVLKIENVKVEQFPFIFQLFPNTEELSIENCSLDEDMSKIAQYISQCYPDKFFTTLNFSLDGLSSTTAINSLKQILTTQPKVENLFLKGLWVHSIGDLGEKFGLLKNLKLLDLSASKYIFNSSNSLTFSTYLLSIKTLNLGDCRIEDEEFDELLKNLNVTNTLEELLVYRNLLSNDSLDSLVKYQQKLKYLKRLNIGFNHKINSKGLQVILDEVTEIGGLEHADLRNCGITLKLSSKSLIDFIFSSTRSKVFKCLELYFCQFKEIDYINFIKSVYEKSSNLCSGVEGGYDIKNLSVDMKIFLKLNSNTNKELFKKVEHMTETIYKIHNLIIR